MSNHAPLWTSADRRLPAGAKKGCTIRRGGTWAVPSTLTRNYTDFWSEHFPDNNFDPANLQLAVRIQSALLRATGEEDRGVRRARFMDVLHGHNHPAILIEGGYLSNPREAGRIADPEFRQKLAEAVAGALHLNPEATSHKPEDAVTAANTNQLSLP